MVKRGRGAPPGELHGMSKLTAAQVLSIRATYAAGFSTYIGLATEYDVSTGTISAILRRRTWKHLCTDLEPDTGGIHGAEQAPAA